MKFGSHSGKFKMTVVGFTQKRNNTILQYVSKRNIKNIKPILDAYINYNKSKLYSDENILYSGYTNRNIFIHNRGEYVSSNIHTNSIERIFSLFKRKVYDIHHQISSKHLEKYINSFMIRYNRKESDFDRLDLALESVFGKKLQYKDWAGKIR